MCNFGLTFPRPTDWCLQYLDEVSTTKDNDTTYQSQTPSTPAHTPSTLAHTPHDLRGFTTADVITDPSLVPVSPFHPDLGETTKDEPEDLDLDIQIFLGIDSSPARRSTLTELSSSPPRRTPRSPSTDVDASCQRAGVNHHCPEESCGQSFKRMNALNRHISSIHKRAGILCPFCPGTKKVFNRSDNFQR
jgi:hypothetical protein